MENKPEITNLESSDEYTSISDTDSLLNHRIQNSENIDNYENLSETEDVCPDMLEGSRRRITPTDVGTSDEESSFSLSENQGEITIRVIDTNAAAVETTAAQPSKSAPEHVNFDSGVLRTDRMWVRDRCNMETPKPREIDSHYRGQPRGARRRRSYGRYQRPNQTNFEPQMESVIEKCEEMTIGENDIKITITNITPKKTEISVLPAKPIFRGNPERRSRSRRHFNFNHFSNQTQPRPSSSRAYEPRRFFSGQQRRASTAQSYNNPRQYYDYSTNPIPMANSYGYSTYANPNVGYGGQYLPQIRGSYNFPTNMEYQPQYPVSGYINPNDYSHTGYQPPIPHHNAIPETTNPYLYDQNYYYQPQDFYGYGNLGGT